MVQKWTQIDQKLARNATKRGFFNKHPVSHVHVCHVSILAPDQVLLGCKGGIFISAKLIYQADWY